MPFDFITDSFDIADAATSFNAAELTGLDSFDAAFEAGITDANAFDFAQGPDGLLGSVIPGAGGELGVEGWYNVDYDQTFFGSDTQAGLFDGGGGVDFDIYNGGTFEGFGGDGIDISSVDGGLVYDDLSAYPTDGIVSAGSIDGGLVYDYDELGAFPTDGIVNAGPESVFDSVFNPRDGTLSVPIPTVGASSVDRFLTGISTQFNAELPKLIAQAKQQAIGQAVGAVTGAVKSTVAKALPAPLAAVANNVVDRAANSTASAFGATPIATSVDLTGGGGGGGGFDINTLPATGAGQNATPVPFTNDAALANLAANIAAGTVGTAVANAAAVAADTGTAITIDNIGNGIASARVVPTGITDPAQAAAANAAAESLAKTQLAQRQQSIAIQRKFEANNGDWRVRISLAPGSDYLYNDPTLQADGTNGILWPLKQSSGVIFPYTPKITTSYSANYSRAELTHSNYMNYFYQSSNVGEISINAKFTAQDTMEAQYLLAVIHFFRSVTRMFYGQDSQRGAPPPLVFLTGFGQFQFQNHPCVVSNFTYDMPENVDYIRARSLNVNGMDLLTRRQRPNAVPGDPISGAYKRLADLFSGQGINKGAQSNSSPTALPSPPALGLNNPTYVPTSVDLSIRLLPVQSRSQVSQQFSLKRFANGQLIAGGFW
jgi:hypothetical protein